MDGVMKTLMKRLLLLSVCALAVLVLLAREHSHGLLSPRQFGVVLLMLCVFMAGGAVLIMRRTVKEFKEPPGPSGTPIDEVTRKRRVLGIRVGKVAIVVLAVSLVLGLRQDGPRLLLLLGAAINLCIMAAVIWAVVRLQKSLN